MEKSDTDMCAMKTVVQSEMKTYSSFFKDTCSSPLAPQTIQAAVKRVHQDEDRSRKIVIYGMKEDEERESTVPNHLETAVLEVLAHLNEKPVILDCARVGKVPDNLDMDRPVLFKLRSAEAVQRILSRSKLLKDVNRSFFAQCYLSPDRTLQERQAYRKLVEKLKVLRSEEHNKVHFIKNNKVVSREKHDSES